MSKPKGYIAVITLIGEARIFHIGLHWAWFVAAGFIAGVVVGWVL